MPEAEGGVLTGAQFAGDKLFPPTRKTRPNQIAIYSIDGKKEGDMKLPGYGSVGIYTERKYPEDIYYTFTCSPPAAQYAYDIKTGESRMLFSSLKSSGA